MPEQHAKRSPSSAHRWLTGGCHAAVTLAQIAPSITSPYAERGTRAHVVIEHCLKKGLRIAAKCPRRLLAELNAEDLAAVQYFLDLVYMQFDLMDCKDGGKPEILAESKCSVAPYLSDCWGTRDVVLWNYERVTVIDYKHGSGVYVPIENNPQLMIYLLGTFIELEFLTCAENCTWQIGIVQPRCKHGGNVARFQTIPYQEILKFRDRLIDYEKSFDPWRFNTGEHCKWCPGISFCPAQMELQIKALCAAKIEHKNPDNTKFVKWVLDNREILKNFITEIEQYALNIRRRGVPIDGYKLVKANKRARWAFENKDMIEILREAIKDSEFDFEDIIDSKPKAIGAIKKILGAEWVNQYIKTPEGEPVLVPANDKRQEIGAFADFED